MGALGGQVGNLRVSNRAVEFDLFAEKEELIFDLIPRVEQALSEIVTLKKLNGGAENSLDVAVALSATLYGEERFWEVHEVLEAVWKGSVGEEKRLLQGVILVAAALVHLQKGRRERYHSIMGRALDRLRGQGSYIGLDVESLRRDVELIVTRGKVLIPRFEIIERARHRT